MKKVFCIDIDGTICTITKNQEYRGAEPLLRMIKKINHLYDAGHTIKMFTARGMSRGKDFKQLTTDQLAIWGVKYHELIMGKPAADFYIDDKGRSPEEFLMETME